jgi:hypothetical protein
MRVASSSPMSPNVAEHVRRRAHLGWIAVAAFLGVVSLGATSQAQTASVVVTSDVNPSVYLQTVTFTANVFPPVATGTVTFKDTLSTTPVQLCINVPLVGGQAQCVKSNLFAGTHFIIARYNGDGVFAATTSAPDTQVVNRAPTTVTLTTNPNPSFFGQNVAMTATLTPSVANGQVKFFSDGSEIGTRNVSGGQATLNFSTLLPGTTHALTASYLGQTNFEPSTSNTVSQSVSKIPSSVSLSFSQNPTTCGLPINLTATLDPIDATGDVQFTLGASPIGIVTTVGGVARLEFVPPTSGTLTLHANYLGDIVYNPSSTSGGLTVSRAASTTTVTSDINPSFVLQSVTFTAQVPSGATGTVTFRDSLTVIGGGARSVNNGQASVTVSNLIGGRHSITGTYSGDGCYSGSVSPPYFQRVNSSPTSLSVSTNPNPSYFNQNVKITATIIPITAVGQVRFFNDGNQIGTATVNTTTGLAVLNFATLLPGGHSLTASFLGSRDYAPSSAPAHSQVVFPGPTSVVLSSNSNPSLFGDAVDLVAGVSPSDATGSVRFYEGIPPDTTFLGDGEVDPGSGVAIFTVPNFSVGVHHLTAKYVGNFVYSFGMSSVFDQTVETPTAMRRADAMVTKLIAEPIESGIRVSWSANRAAFKNLELQRAIATTGPWGKVDADVREDQGSMVAEDITAGPGRTYFYRVVGTTTGGTQSIFGPVEGAAGAPREFALSGVWPNPSKGAMTMAISVPKAASLRVSVLDLQGREVAVLADGGFPAGRHEVRWDGRTSGGQAAAGLYFIRVITPEKKFVSRVAIAH